MGRCVIIGGADIGNYEEVRKLLCESDFNIFCDCGMRHAEKLLTEPHLIVGDFDSSENPKIDVETIVLPREKDDTDTVFAVKEAVKRGFDDFLLVGVIGGRLDHTLGNVAILLYIDTLGGKGKIVDDFSEMEIVSDKTAFVDDSFEFFSLINISGKAKGVTIKNAKFPLSDAEITCEYQYGVSNEVLPGKVAEITVADGKLLLIKVK